MGENEIVSVERVIAARPEAIFEVLADPDRHHDIDGSGAVVNASRSILYAFEKEPYRSRFGADWGKAIAAAAADFRDDLARALDRHVKK